MGSQGGESEVQITMTEDPVSMKNKCSDDVLDADLEEVTIRELDPGDIYLDSILWAKTIAPAYQIAGVMLVVEDKNQDVIQINLHNQVRRHTSFEELNQMIPEGTKIGIK